MNYALQVLETIEQAFAHSTYEDAPSRARLRSESSTDLLAAARTLLKKELSSVGPNAPGLFMLAILSRYLSGGKEEYVSRLEAALRCDPTFPEAAIALRDGEQYADPFCYPRWEDLRDGVVKPPPTVLQMPGPNLCRFDVVRYDGLLVPAVFVKHNQDLFRVPLTARTPVKILVNAESVLPGMPALVQVVPVIFDDHDDPFWCVNYLNPFPIGEEGIGGVPIFLPVDYQPWLGRDIARRFCWGPPGCALFVLNDDNQLLMSRLLVFDETAATRLREMDRVLGALGDNPIGYRVWKSASELHLGAFYREVENPAGKMLVIPRGRAPAMARKFIHAVTVRGDGKLTLKGTAEAFAAHESDRRHDVFISHAHEDNPWVLEIVLWLVRIWPAIRVYHTNPTEHEQFDQDPMYFYREMVHSHSVVILLTPRSIRKPWVGAERAAAASSSAIYLLAGGTSSNDLRRETDGDLFASIDYSKAISVGAVEGWAEFAQLLAAELTLPIPEKLPSSPVLKPIRAAASQENLSEKFMDEFLWKIVLPDRQTEQQATVLLEQVETHLGQKGGRAAAAVRGLTSGWPLRKRLACVLMSLEEEVAIIKFLDYFPALVDQALLAELQTLAGGTSDPGMLSRRTRLSTLVGARARQSEASMARKKPRSESLGRRAVSAVFRFAKRFQK